MGWRICSAGSVITRRPSPYTDERLEFARGAFGLDHPDVATSLNGLAELSPALKRKMTTQRPSRSCDRPLPIREKLLGPGHPRVAESL